MRGQNDDEIIDFIDFTRDRPIDVRFIEYMPFQGNEWKENKMVSFDEMKRIIRKKYPDFQALPNQPNDTSKVCFLISKLNYSRIHYTIQCSFLIGLSRARIYRAGWIYYIHESTLL